MRKKTGALVIFNILGFVLVLILNGLANALPLNGLNTGEISDMFPNYFTPAGFTFSIWGIIYLFLTFFIVRQVIYYIKHRTLLAEVEKIGGLFVFSSLMNAGWIAAWHYLQITASFVIMILLLITLLLIYNRLNAGRKAGAKTQTQIDRWAMYVPFSLYLGWITAATIANLTALMIHYGFDSLGSPGIFWASIMVFFAALIGTFVLAFKEDFVFAGVLLWTFAGIIAARLADPEPAIPVIVITVLGILMLLYGMIRVGMSTKPH
jgi:translocator protein